jgi:protein ImuA
MSSSAVRAETIEALRRQLVSTQRTQSSQQCISTGLRSLDDLLPGGGLPASGLTEWISDDVGQSAASIALRAIAPMLALPGCLAVIDERHEFHADAARSQGISLSRLLLVRPQHPGSESSSPVGRSRFVRRTSAAHGDALWALEQTARCPGVRAVLYWLDRSSSAVMRRLQLAVERSGVSVVLIRPASVLQQPSFADLRLHVQTVNQPDQSGWEPRVYSVRLLRSRHGLQHKGRALLCQGPWQESIICQTELSSPRR